MAAKMFCIDEIPLHELEFNQVRASGPGGQHVNKVSTAIHLRFDVGASSLPEHVKSRILSSNDSRVSSDGIVVIKARNYRSQEKNRADALSRLELLIQRAMRTPKARRSTRPTRSSVTRRLDAKNRRGGVKRLRGKPGED